MAIRLLSSESIDGTFKIGSGSLTNPSTNANDIVIDNGAGVETGMTFASSVASSIRFGDFTNNSIGSIEYIHSGNHLRFITNGTERVRITGVGNVGIGEDTPLVPLHISRNSISGENIALILDNNNTAASGQQIGMLFRSAAAGNNTDFEIFGLANAANDMDLVFESDGSVERVRFTGDGNVGIGTTGPQTKLQVNGDISVTSGDAYRMFNAAGTGWGEMSLNETDNIVSFNRGIENTGNDWKLSENSASSYVCALQGNFGIGVTSPSWNLQVAGRALIADTTARLPFYVSRAGGGAVTNAATIVSGAAAYFNGNIAGSDALRIGSMDNGTGAYYIDVSNYAGTAAYNLILQPFLGNVGIGTTSPSQKLEVSGNTYVTGYVQASSAVIGLKNGFATFGSNSLSTGIALSRDFLPSSYPDLIINSAGNVGIGTDSPTDKLDVFGGARIGGAVTGVVFKLEATDTAGAPAMTTTMKYVGYEGRGIGNLYYDTSYTGEWFAGLNYSGGFNNWSIGFDGTGGQAEYTANAKFTVTQNGNIYMNQSDVFMNRTLINTTSGDGNINVASAALGSAVGSQTRQADFKASDGNTTHLEIKDIRSSTTQNWTGAGKRIQCRVDNTYMGYMQFNGTGNNYGISFGTGATTTVPGNVAEKMRIEASGDVGIGTTNPGAKLEVNGDILLTYLKATGNSVIGGTSINSSRLSVQDSKNGSASSPHLQILGNGYSAYHYLNTTAYNIVTNSTTREIRVIAQNGGVKLAYAATAWVANSDIALKENIKPLENVLDKIKDYRCVEYNLKESPEDKKIGFIAQDWVDDFPVIVNKNEKDMLGMKYTETIPVLLKAIQELKAEIEILKSK